MYWLMRSASWPPVSVVSPRKSTGLSLLRLSAPTVRCPDWMGWRSSSSVMTSRLERVTERATAHAGFSAACGLASLLGCLLGKVGSPLDFLLDPRVVLRELLAFGNAAHLELDAGAERTLLCPLLGLVLRRHVEDPKPVEQFLGLGVRAICDDRRVGVEVDDETLVRPGQRPGGS